MPLAELQRRVRRRIDCAERSGLAADLALAFTVFGRGTRESQHERDTQND